MSNKTSDDDSGQIRDPREEQALNSALQQAISAVAAGQSAASVESIAAGNLPSHLREKFKQMLRAQLAKRGLGKQQASADAADKKTPALKGIFALMAKQAYDRIVSLMRSRPDVARNIKQVGQVLAASGVTPDKARVTEADLGRISPSQGLPGQAQDQDRTR